MTTTQTMPDLYADDTEVPDIVGLVERAQSTQIAYGRRLISIVRTSKMNGRDAKAEGFIATPTQRRDIKGYAKAHHCTIVKEYEELDVGGGKIDRTAIDSALADIAAGKADGIIVAYLSRYARTTAGLQLVRKLQADGKAFISVAEGIGPEMLGNSFGWFTFTIMLAVAELQLGMLTEGFLTARKTHIAAGIANQVPYGYRKRGAHEKKNPRRLEPDPETSKWVAFIFDRRAVGDSWITIARTLDEKGAPVPGGGQRWLYTRVRHIVSNRTYLGELHSKEFVNLKAHPAIVTRKKWDAANKLNQTPVRNGAAAYLLTGIIRCASCGGRMVGFMQTTRHNGKVAKNAYYRCRRNYSWGRCEAPAYVPARELERLVVDEFFRRFCGDLDATREVEDHSADLAAAQAVIDECNAALDRFLDSPQTKRTAERRGQAWYDDKLGELNDAVEAAEAAWQDIRNAMTGVELPAGLIEDWPSIGLDAQRGFLSDGFGVVAVKAGGGRRNIPVADRIRIWARNEPGSPESKLPRRGAKIDDKITAKVPIEF